MQTFLAKNSETLKKFGLLVPEAGRIGDYAGHHNIAWQLIQDDRYDGSTFGSLSTLISEIALRKWQSIVISSEDFEYMVCNPNSIRTLELALEGSGYEIEYIVYFRDQVSYANSLYAELVKHGLAQSIDEFVEHINRDGVFRFCSKWCFYFDYALFLKKWRATSRKAIHCRFFHLANDAGRLETDILNVILSKADIGRIISDSELPGMVNESLGPHSVIALWLLNYMVGPRHSAIVGGIKDAVLNACADLDCGMGKFDALSKRQRHQIRARFTKCNRLLQRHSVLADGKLYAFLKSSISKAIIPNSAYTRKIEGSAIFDTVMDTINAAVREQSR
jgi:hypothetical protein